MVGHKHNAPQYPANKSELIRNALAAGITNNTEIAKYIWRTERVLVSETYISVIKSNEKRKGRPTVKIVEKRGELSELVATVETLLKQYDANLIKNAVDFAA